MNLIHSEFDIIDLKSSMAAAEVSFNPTTIQLFSSSMAAYSTFGNLTIREFGIRKPLKKLWEWNVFSTFKGENQQVT